MHFETAQLLDLVAISKETLRHWKRVLSPIRGRDGRSQGYSFEEVVALSLIAHANRDLAVPISRFTPVASRLFSEVGAQVRQGSTSFVLCITDGDMALVESHELPDEVTMALVRVEPIIRSLLRTVSADHYPTEDQLVLPF